MTRLLLLLCLFFSAFVQAEDVCLPEDDFDELMKHLANMQTLEEALPVLTVKPFTITIDAQGRVFVDAVASGELTLGYLNFKLDIALPTTVHRQEIKEERSFFRTRYKAAGYADLGRLSAYNRLGGAALVEPFHLSIIGFNLLIGSTASGVGISFGLTKNLDIYVAAAARYDDWTIAPVVGVALSIN